MATTDSGAALVDEVDFSDSDNELDDVKLVLDQGDEEWEEDDAAADAADDAAQEAAPPGAADAADGEDAAEADGSAAPATPAASAARAKTSAKKSSTSKNTWVNPNLAASDGAPASGTKRSAASAEEKKAAAAKRAKLGPLVHMPGAKDIDLSEPLPPNIDVDLVQDKAWRRPDADITDYFNYGFTEDTWRLYCQRQQELRLETQNSANMVAPVAAAGAQPQQQQQQSQSQRLADLQMQLTQRMLQQQQQKRMQMGMQGGGMQGGGMQGGGGQGGGGITSGCGSGDAGGEQMEAVDSWDE